MEVDTKFKKSHNHPMKCLSIILCLIFSGYFTFAEEESGATKMLDSGVGELSWELDRVLDADAKTNGQELKIQTEAMLAEGDFPSKSYRIAAAEAEKGSSVGVHIAIKNVQMSEEQLVLSAITPIIQCRVEMNVAKTPAAPAP